MVTRVEGRAHAESDEDQPEGPSLDQRPRVAVSFGRDEYEAIVPFVLERVRLGAKDIDAAADTYARGTGTEPNQLRLARIEEERDRAVAAYRRDRDPLALEQTMRELDTAEAEADGDQERPMLPPDEVRRYLENLASWWADADRRIDDPWRRRSSRGSACSASTR